MKKTFFVLYKKLLNYKNLKFENECKNIFTFIFMCEYIFNKWIGQNILSEIIINSKLLNFFTLH